MKAHIITLFPDAFTSYFSSSIMRIAREKELFEAQFYNLSDFSDRPQGRVDDAPYGGGAGQLIQVKPIFEAIQSIEGKVKSEKGKIRKIFLGPSGKQLVQVDCVRLAGELIDEDVIILCGHYEGVDHRIFELFEWEQYRIGDYVVSSGEIAAMVFLDSIIRLLPGVVGNPESVVDESFSESLEGGIEYPQYTRPAEFEGIEVPETLLSGDHEKIAKWRKDNIRKT